VEKALELAHLIATKAPRSITAAKKVMNGFRHDAFSAGMARENEWCSFASRSEDCKEGMKALKEKRQPVFHNR
jgi:enoyl-CoA hydratase/carnithine racemase